MITLPKLTENPGVGAQATSPFGRLRDLLHGLNPGARPIDLSIGGPRHAFPSMVGEILAAERAGFGKYPPARGTPSFRKSVGSWLDRRYGLGGRLDPDASILPLAGSREGLFLIAMLAADRARARGVDRPAMLVPNPFYQTYASAVHAAGAEPVYLPASEDTGFLPDLTDVSTGVLDRLAAIYLCSPANPQGSVASLDYWRQLIALARARGALVFADECYSEIYRKTPPPGALEAADGDYTSVLSFNSLSKRSSLPGLRAGFVAGDADLISDFFIFRNVAAATVPLPVLAVAEALYGDETHVLENRQLYNRKFDCAKDIVGDLFGHQTPDGGFFLWLDTESVGGGEVAAKRLWQDAGVKVLPGSFLTMASRGTVDPGKSYIRVALVADLKDTAEALSRIKGVFG